MASNLRASSHRIRISAPLAALMTLSLVWGSSGGAGRAQGVDPAPGGTTGGVVATAAAGAKGAQIYCFMRSAGNSHDVSWTAAYALIKRQSANLFKTSPEHAAVMITEAVVQNPGSYPDCGKFLGDLFVKSAARDAAAAAAAAGSTNPTTAGPASGTGAEKPASGNSRYAY